MAGAMDKHLPQQTGVPCRANHARICLLVLVDYKPVASGMHGKYRHIQVAVEDNVVAEVVYRLWISVDAWSGCKRLQVIIQLETSLFVEAATSRLSAEPASCTR